MNSQNLWNYLQSTLFFLVFYGLKHCIWDSSLCSWGRKSCCNPDIIFQVHLSTIVVPSISSLSPAKRTNRHLLRLFMRPALKGSHLCKSLGMASDSVSLSAADSPRLCPQRSYDHLTHSVGSALVEITETPKFLILKRYRLAFVCTPHDIELSWLYTKVHEL